MQIADLIFISISGLMADVYNIMSFNVAYCNRLYVNMAIENSSENEFQTLHYVLQYFFCIKTGFY